MKQDPEDMLGARRTESTPSQPPYRNSGFELAGTIATEDAKMIHDVYLSSSRPPPDELIKEAARLANCPRPSKREVGVTGNSGSGKSSCIYSLLETEGIAIVDGSGKAVTCFPVQYQYCLPHQATKYVVHCIFPDECKADNLFQTFLDDMNALDQPDQEDRAASEQEICEEKSRAAEDTFKALFGKMNGFSINKLRIGHGKVTMASARTNLLRWRQQLSWPEGMDEEGFWSSPASSVKDLHDIQARFRDSGLWPLIERLTIFLEAPLLKNGVVSVDLPGFHDANFARVRIARETQAKCDDLLVVANINRAVDNPNLQAIVKENTPRPGVGVLTLQTVTVVNTHSAVFEKDIEQLADPEALKAAKANITQLKKKGASWKEIEDAMNESDNIVVRARNRKVKKDMLDRYGSRLSAGQFHVFCVDNALFMDRESDRTDISEIPLLQTHVQDLPARALFQVNDSFIGNDHHAMYYTFETWVYGCRPRPDAFNVILPEPEALRNFHRELKDWTTNIGSSFEEIVLKPLRIATPRINAAALAVAESWREVHFGTVRAICKKYGRHITKTSRNFDWNGDLIDCFLADIEHNWFQFESMVHKSLLQLKELISKAFQEYPNLCSKLGAPHSFLMSLKSRQQGVDDAVRFARDSFLRELGKLKRKATVSHDGSYVLDSMLPAYEDADEVSGKGARNRRHEILEGHVGSPKFVTEICKKMSEDFEELIQSQTAAVLEKIESATKAIEATVDNFQGKRDEIPLFLVDPQFGCKVKGVLRKLGERKDLIDNLAAPARQQAAELYGEDVLHSMVTCETGARKESTKEDASCVEDEQPAKRIKREHLDNDDDDGDDGDDADTDWDIKNEWKNDHDEYEKEN